MTDPRLQTADRLEQAAAQASRRNAFVGLDGFVDEIFHVVDKRENASSYTRLPTIARFAERLAQAAGKSTNIELVSQQVKLGGNGPIMANALASLGSTVTYLGNLGYPALHPVFEEFSRRARVHSIAEPGFTDALEFEDGKIMAGKHEALKEVNWENIVARFGIDRLQASLEEADLVCLVNWTMYTATSRIWEAIQREIAPRLNGERRVLFIDLADPEKRSTRDLRQALELVGRFQDTFEVTLGLNEKESSQIGAALELDTSDHSSAGLAELAARIRSTLQLNSVVIHPVRFAVAAHAKGTAEVEGPFTPRPRITTGAGDHFNAGFCVGHALGFDTEHSLLTGVACSGFYVRTGRSPDLRELAEMLRNWPQPGLVVQP